MAVAHQFLVPFREAMSSAASPKMLPSHTRRYQIVNQTCPRHKPAFPSCCVRVYRAETQECPLQVCQLSRSSESTYFLSFLRDVALFKFHQSPGWLMRSGARASDLFPDNHECKTPSLSYETHPSSLNSDSYRPFFRGRISTLSRRFRGGEYYKA